MEALGHQERKSQATRSRVLASTVDLIRKEGLPSASPLRIARHTGLSWGAVQHHFGSKDQLLRTVVLLSRDLFHAAVGMDGYEGLALEQRIDLFVDRAWRHYQSDVFLASVEITFWHRNNGTAPSEDISADNGRTDWMTREMLGRVFGGIPVEIEKLVEASAYMHCVLTGLAFHVILSGGDELLRLHLEHCKHAMAEIVRGTHQ